MENLEDIKNIARKCLNCKNPSCVHNCPLENHIPQILNYIKEDDISRAKQELLKTTNVSFICSSLCDYDKQCYGNCILNKTPKGGVEFYKVEKYLSKLISNDDYMIEKQFDDNVAIIGAGVAGITVAIELAKVGFNVTIYEKKNYIGGVINDSLPSFRYDSNNINVLNKILQQLNVNIKYNCDFGHNLLLDDLKKYNQLVFANGTYLTKSTLSNHPQVLDGLKILQDAKKHQLNIQNKDILVIGGGNVAMDVARTLKRNNNNVSIVYRRNIKNAPSSIKEINDTIAEGVKFLELLSPNKINNKNEKLILEVEKNILVNDPTSSRMMFNPTGEFINIECDFVVEAIGINADYCYLKEMIPSLFTEKGWPKEFIKFGNQNIYTTGDYYNGSTNFAKASKQAILTSNLIKENICK